MDQAPQLENGYTRLANELLDALLAAGLTSRQWAVVMAVVRKTYGFNKKEDDIGLSQLAEMTGIAKPHVSTAIRDLEARNILNRKKGRFGHILGLNKAFKTWVGVTKTVTVTESVTVTETVIEGYQNSNPGVTESVIRGYQIGKAGVTDSVTTKDNPTKDNQKTTPKDSCASLTLRERFERFYAAYPKKKSRANAEKAFAKLNPDEQLLAEMISAVRRAMKSGQWADPKFIPYPASWLNASAWLDDVQTEYDDTERAVILAFNDALGEQLGVIDTGIFSESRAGAIRAFLAFSDKPDFAQAFFAWVRDNCDLPPKVGFDWLISRDAFTRIKGGQHNKREFA